MLDKQESYDEGTNKYEVAELLLFFGALRNVSTLDSEEMQTCVKLRFTGRSTYIYISRGET
jgi:hypothetical protein